ncbi:MAG: tRNA nucleotidyltransferase [Clostridia bacterium]|nr:tRNA nucleotidyltransferase [Clostridia bacterium]
MNELLQRIAGEIAACGGRALLVGGCVRDYLLGIPCQDIDCEVHGLEAGALRALLARHGDIDESGEAFGIFTLKSAGIDFALPRMEKRTGSGHTDFTVTPVPSLSPERAAARRDFTVNAIMRDALTGEIIDPYGGREDLKKGILRAVPGGQFMEDPLRVLRGAQFAARFSLTPQENTLQMMREMPLDHLSAARVEAEMKKALLGAQKPDIFFRVLKDADALLPWFKEIHDLVGVPQNPKYHPEGDAFEHTMLVLREAAALSGQAENPYAFMLSALTHDLGKAVTTEKNEKGEWASIAHEIRGLPLIERLFARLLIGKQETQYCKNLCKLHMRVHTCYYGQARASRTNVLFDACVKPRDLAKLCICDVRGTGKPPESAQKEEAFIITRLRLYEEAAARPMPTGDMLIAAGVKPGPQMKELLRAAREKALSGMDAQKAVQAVAGKK